MIKVNNKEVEFQEGMTIAAAMKSAGQSLDQMVIVMANGQVISKVDLNKETVIKNMEIIILPLMSGG